MIETCVESLKYYYSLYCNCSDEKLKKILKQATKYLINHLINELIEMKKDLKEGHLE